MSCPLDGAPFAHRPRKSHVPFWFFVKITKAVFFVLFIIVLTGPLVFPHHVEGALGIVKNLSYQGRLTDTNGNALGGSGTNYCFSFSIFDASSLGNKLWPSTATTTSTLMVTNGVFNTSIGPVDTFDFSSNDTVYLNVDVAAQSGGTCTSVSWEALGPRQQINAVAYARAAYSIYGGDAQLGDPNGVTSGQKLLKLAVKSVADTVGANTCSPNGALWYNSGNARTLVCNNNLYQVVGSSITNQFFDVSGPTTTGGIKTFTFPDASATVLTSANAVTAAQGGTGVNSSAWNGPVSVQAGTWVATTTVGILYGGTGQTTATAAFDALDPLTTKGDMIASNGTNAVRVPVGANNKVLTASSTSAYGVDWMTPASGASSAATYITQTADASLSAEQALSALPTGYMKVTTGTGVVSSQAVPIPIADGGTNSTATPTNGGIGYGTGTAHAYTSAGTSGQYLKSAGAAAPVWADAPSIIRLTAAYTNGTTSLTNTALTWAIAASARSGFTCYLMVRESSTSYGVNLAVTAPASATGVYRLRWDSAAGTAPATGGTQAFVETNTFATALGPAAGLTANTLWELDGVVLNSTTAGNVTVQGKSTSASATATVDAGSYCVYYSM